MLAFWHLYLSFRECSPGLSGIVSISAARPRTAGLRRTYVKFNEFLRHRRIGVAGFCRILRSLARGCAGTGLAARSEFFNPRRSRNASEAIEPHARYDHSRMVLCHAYGRDVAGNPQGLPVMVVLTRSANLVTVPARPFC
jgi:hypothetical protein